jgi:hypothetical protein
MYKYRKRGRQLPLLMKQSNLKYIPPKKNEIKTKQNPKSKKYRL